MIGANKKRQFTTAALAALLGAGMSGIALSSAYAGGDIGGNCCADLEERVAELEATTARKGNRKVSLTVSGQVNRAVMFWDDSIESDAYVVDNQNSSSRFLFTGSAKIRDGWSAGYHVEIEFDDAESSVVNQGQVNGDDGLTGTNGALDLRMAYWYLKSDRYGTINVGQAGHATYLITWMDTSGTLVASTSDKRLVGGALRFRTAGGNIGTAANAIGAVANPYYIDRGDIVRYDSPTIAGFKLSAAWGEDDAGDVALRYAGKIGDFKVLAGIGFAEVNDENADFEQVSGSFSAFHIPTGLNITFAGGDRDTVGSTLDQTYWYVKGGLRRKFNPLGDTAFSVDYYHQDEQIAAGGEFEQWGIQVVQHIDAAAMEIYFAFSNSDYHTTAATFEEVDIFMAGAKIAF